MEFVALVGKPRARCVARTRARVICSAAPLATPSPRTRGEGGASVMRGDYKKKRANENVWRSPKYLRSVESCAPSTTLRSLRESRVVPLPRFAGADVTPRRSLAKFPRYVR